MMISTSAPLQAKLLAFLRAQHKSYGGMALAEQAVPSYIHTNRLVSYTFWRRLKTVVRLCTEGREAGDILDFGAGTGILLPFLRTSGTQKIIAVETEPHARKILAELGGEFSLPQLQILLSAKELEKVPDASIDTITALDVFEHIDELDEVLLSLRRILKPNGLLVVSSPTETALYKFMRRFGGPEYTGHYHVSDAAQVERCLAKYFSVKLAARLYPGLEFFRIVQCRRLE